MAENVEDKVVTVGGLKAKHTYDETTYLKKSGDTMSGTLILTNANDASPTAYDTTKPPALVVGGATTAAHLEIDTNEILAKSKDDAPGNLFLNDDVASDSGVKVGISGSVDINTGSITPRVDTSVNPNVLKSIDIGAVAAPFNHMYGVNYNLFKKYSNTDTDYGALRAGSTTEKDEEGKDVTRPTGILELGNDSNVDGRITMYGNGTIFTNIFTNSDRTAGNNSNKVLLPRGAGTMLVYKASTTDISVGSNLAADTLYLVYE